MTARSAPRSFCARYGALYERPQHQMPPRAWDRELVDKVTAARRADLPVTDISQRQTWRDKRLMARLARDSTARLKNG
jgi:L-gulonate 3-dehydrogenase